LSLAGTERPRLSRITPLSVEPEDEEVSDLRENQLKTDIFRSRNKAAQLVYPALPRDHRLIVKPP